MDPITMAALISAGSALATKFINPGKGYKKAENALRPYYEQGQAYLQPYNQQGQEAYGHLNGAMENLLNPSGLYDQFLNDYKMSDAAKLAQQRTADSGFSALASQGLTGSSAGARAMQAGTADIAAQDEQRYLERMIQQYLQGAGIAQNIYGQGANAAGQQGNNALNMGSNVAGLAYGKQNAPGSMFGNLLGTGAQIGAAYYGNQNNGGWNTYGGNNGSPQGATPPLNGFLSGGNY